MKVRESDPLSKEGTESGVGCRLDGAALIVFCFVFWTGLVFCADAGLDLPSHLHSWPGECEAGKVI